MSAEKRSSNVLAVTLVVAVAFQIFLSVLILNELRALPGKMPAAGPAMAQARGLDAGTEAPTAVDPLFDNCPRTPPKS
ncbi:MAG: hypothetical protein GY856_38105 [bacterium]|nr:hypothetical protein [bacterium]